MKTKIIFCKFRKVCNNTYQTLSKCELGLINYRFSSFVCQHTYFSLVGLFSKHHNSFSLHDILNIHWTVEQRLHANYGGSATTFNKNEVSLCHDREYRKHFSDTRTYLHKSGPMYRFSKRGLKGKARPKEDVRNPFGQ